MTESGESLSNSKKYCSVLEKISKINKSSYVMTSVNSLSLCLLALTFCFGFSTKIVYQVQQLYPLKIFLMYETLNQPVNL